MEALLGSSLGVFIGLTVCVVGFAAWMTGQALAVTWKPAWHLVIYALLLGAANRFLNFGLFDGELLAFGGFVVNSAVLLAIALLSFRYNRVRATVRQYPWLWRRSGPFGLRRIGGGGTARTDA
ncbi:MAG TPA: hypothetical protein VIX81_03440 [Gammaproteobacteria bacterium]